MALTLVEMVSAEIKIRRATQRRNLAIRVGSISLLLIVWELAGFYTSRIFLAPFHDTVLAFWGMTQDGTLLIATLNSLGVLLIGLAISGGLGSAIGLVMGRYRRIDWMLSPYINGLYATPTVALLPVLSLWLGLYAAPKITLVVLLAIFPIIKNTYAGVVTLGQDLLEPAASMKASEVQLFHLVIMPAIVPFVMAGFRLAIGRGIVGLIVGEFFTAQNGLGGILVSFASSFRTAEMFVPIIVLVIIGYSLTTLVVYLQKRLTPWKESERDQGV